MRYKKLNKTNKRIQEEVVLILSVTGITGEAGEAAMNDNNSEPEAAGAEEPEKPWWPVGPYGDPRDAGTYREIVAVDVKSYGGTSMGYQQLVRAHRSGDSVVCLGCVAHGMKSTMRLYTQYGSSSFETFYDEDGKYHHHQSGDTCGKWKCSKDHEGSYISRGVNAHSAKKPCCGEMEYYMELHWYLNRPLSMGPLKHWE
jgi:hypothetical protein